MLRILLPHKGEDNVIGIKITRGGKVLVALKLHALAQMEGVGFTILADLPAFGEARLQLGGANLKVHQPVIDRNRAGIDAGTGGVELRIEVLRRSFGY